MHINQDPQPKDEKQIRSVFVGNIPYEANDEDLKNVFSKIGQVVSFRIVYDRETGKPKGYGFCEYRDVETAQSAIRNLNGLELHNRTLRVDSAVNEKGKEELKEVKAPEIPNCGPSVPSESASESIVKVMSSMPAEQVFELLQQTKACIQNNPDESREMLIRNPQLGFALLQALILLKIVDPKMTHELILKQPKFNSVLSPQIPPQREFPKIHDQRQAPQIDVPVTHKDIQNISNRPGLSYPHDQPPPKPYRRESPRSSQYPSRDYDWEYKRQPVPPRLPQSELNDYYEDPIVPPFSRHPMLPPHSAQYETEYQYYERDRSGQPRYAGSYDQYQRDPRDPSGFPSPHSDPRANPRREREKISPRDSRPYETREGRSTQRSSSMISDPRLAHQKPGPSIDDQSHERRERDYPHTAHPIPHSSDIQRFRSSRFH